MRSRQRLFLLQREVTSLTIFKFPNAFPKSFHKVRNFFAPKKNQCKQTYIIKSQEYKF